MRDWAASIAMILALGGCASLPAVTCEPDEVAGETAHLFFGRNIGAAPGVSEPDFQAFVAEHLTARFPDGLTVLPAEGRWRSEAGLMGQEASMLVIIAAEGRLDRADLNAVRTAYKTRFHQEAVLQLIAPVCIAY